MSSHSGQLRPESAEAKAWPIIAEELKRLRWSQDDLKVRLKGDPLKPGVAARLRREPDKVQRSEQTATPQKAFS